MKKVKKNCIFSFISAILLLLLPVVLFADYNIAVIKDGELTQFNDVSQGFISTILQKPNYSVKEFNIGGSIEKGQEVANQINESDYHLVFTVGERSAYVAAMFTEEIPIIFSMSLNYQDPRFNLINNPRVTGISLQVPIENIFFFLQMLVPTAQRVGIIHSERSQEIVKGIKEKESNLGVTIFDSEVNNFRAARRAYTRLKRNNIQVYYMVTDPVIYDTTENAMFFIDECKKDGIPFIAYSDAFVRAGAFMTVSPSYPTIGSQAASIAESILDYKMSPADLGIASPIGTFSVVNDITRGELNLEIDPSIYNFIDEVIRAE